MTKTKAQVTEESQATQKAHYHLLVISCDEDDKCCKVYPEELRVHEGCTVVIIARNTNATITLPNLGIFTDSIVPPTIEDFRNGGLANAVSILVKMGAKTGVPDGKYPYSHGCTECKDCPSGGPRMIVE